MFVVASTEEALISSIRRHNLSIKQNILIFMLLLLSIILLSTTCTMMKKIAQILPPQRSHWVGDGFLVTPVFANKAFTNDISPFLMFDYGSPRTVEPSDKQEGVGEHPHRGFETVTIAFQGEVEHKDSTGSAGIIGPGDVQWMTAGSGVVHQEFLSKRFMKQGGVVEMAQLWVNLPSKHKMTNPKYQEITSKSIPVVPLPEDAGQLRVIAGSYLDHQGPADTFTPMNVFDIALEKDKQMSIDIDTKHNSILFVRRGGIKFGESKTSMSQGQVALLTYDGSTIEAEATEPNTALLLLTGEPLNEPIANHGPFVMNTRRELVEAFEEFQSGNFIKSTAGNVHH
jgi:quercetin 2,3-dioxygenase